MKPETLRHVGEALHGRFWQGKLSFDLRVSDRTIRRWLDGDAMPPNIAEALREICLAKRVEISDAITELEKESA